MTAQARLSYISNFDLIDITEPPHVWNVDFISVSEDKTIISGWCLPIDGMVNTSDMLVNGLSHPYLCSDESPTIGTLYPWHPNAALSPFKLTIEHAQHDLSVVDELVILPSSRMTGNTASYPIHCLIKDLSFEMPPADVAIRIGATDLAAYVIQGRTLFHGFENALRKNFGRGFADYNAILDWGCGSGRVARHVLKAIGATEHFTGFDIDAEAVAWANARFGEHFRVCNTEPPLDLPAASIDLAYSYSVFTHLAEDGLRSWARELARVTKPGGILLFSVLSDVAMVTQKLTGDRDLLTAWNQRGIFDSLLNSNLDQLEVSSDYYRNVFLKKSFIEKEFGEYFDLVDFIPGFHFYQDLVVARRK